MIKIKIFSSFSESKQSKEAFERVNNANVFNFYGRDQKYFITDDDNYTHAIIMNTVMPELNIPKENVIGLSFEPLPFLDLTTEFVEYAKKHIGRYFIGDKIDLPEPFFEHFSYMWYARPPKEITVKNKLMSIIVSEKQFAPGHIFRHYLVEKIIEFNLPIDIYGRGSEQYKYDRVMGNFIDDEPYKDYLYTISIENFACNHYFSEKIISPIMFNCMPLYLGCKTISNYLENVILLDSNIDNNINIITTILENPVKYYRKPYTERNLKSVNFIENLPNIFP
jgi:hypothetical protein